MWVPIMCCIWYFRPMLLVMNFLSRMGKEKKKCFSLVNGFTAKELECSVNLVSSMSYYFGVYSTTQLTFLQSTSFPHIQFYVKWTETVIDPLLVLTVQRLDEQWSTVLQYSTKLHFHYFIAYWIQILAKVSLGIWLRCGLSRVILQQTGQLQNARNFLWCFRLVWKCTGLESLAMRSRSSVYGNGNVQSCWEPR